MEAIKWTDEVIQFMIENYEGKDNIELAELLNKKFNLNTNGDRVSNVKSNLKRRKGINLCTGINRGCIQKGNTPWNKDTKGICKPNKTSFKKGNIPPNRREIFEERITKDGFIEIKVQDNKLNNNWKLKHRYIWEQHNGEIPKGHKIIFLDGNRLNIELDNLAMVSDEEELILNHRKMRYNKKELTKSAINVAKMLSKAGAR